MMKKITLMFALLAMSFGYSQESLPYDFGTIASPTTHGIAPDAADPTNVVTNEVDPDDVNNSVLQIVGGGAEWDNAQVTFTTPIDLSDNENNVIRLKFRDMTSTTFPSTHAIKFEGGAGGPETTELTFSANDNAWHTIDLDYPGGLGTFTKMVIFTDFGVAGPTGTYLIDDMEQTGAPCVSPVLSTTPIDFSSPEDAAFTTGDLASIAIIDDGGNDVLELVGADNNWDNAQVTFCTPQDLSDDANNTIRFKMKSTTAEAGEVHQHGLKFEAGDPVAISEFNFNTTGNDWNDIEIDFPAGLGTFGKMIIFVDTPVLGIPDPITNNEIGTYLIDDITLGATVLGVEDFEINAFSVYPNPSKNIWTIKTKNESISAVYLYDVLGKQVLSLSPNKSLVTIDGSSLKAGIYFAQLKTAAGIKSLKLIKQ